MLSFSLSLHPLNTTRYQAGSPHTSDDYHVTGSSVTRNAKANSCSACPVGTYSMPGFCGCQTCPCGTTTTTVGSTVCTAIPGATPCACVTTAIAVTQSVTGVSLTAANQPAFKTAFIGSMVLPTIIPPLPFHPSRSLFCTLLFF